MKLFITPFCFPPWNFWILAMKSSNEILQMIEWSLTWNLLLIWFYERIWSAAIFKSSNEILRIIPLLHLWNNIVFYLHWFESIRMVGANLNWWWYFSFHWFPFAFYFSFLSPASVMTSVQFEWGDNFRVKPNELLCLLIEGTKIEDSYLTFMRNCLLGGDNFRAFRVDLGGQNSKGDNFQLYHTNKDSPRTHYKKKCKADTDKEKMIWNILGHQ